MQHQLTNGRQDVIAVKSCSVLRNYRDSHTKKWMSLLGSKLRDKLRYYCEDGNLPVSSQIAENAIRPFAVVRKNFFFFGTPCNAAIIQSDDSPYQYRYCGQRKSNTVPEKS